MESANGSIKVIGPQFKGDRCQVVRVYGYHMSLICWADTIEEARKKAREYRQMERGCC